jgi:hypothetical protein
MFGPSTDSSKEAGDKQVDLSENDPDIVARILLYLYTKEYSFELPPNIGSTRLYAGPNVSSGRPAEKARKSSFAASATSTFLTTQNGFFPPSKDPFNSRFLMSNTIRTAQLTDEEVHVQLDVHARIYASADEYGILGLKKISCQKFVELAFKHPTYFYQKPFFAGILRYILENTIIEKELDANAVHTKHGLRLEVLTRLLQAVKSSTSPHFKNLEEFEPVATQISVQRSAEISRVQRLYEQGQDANNFKTSLLSHARRSADHSEENHNQIISQFQARLETLEDSLVSYTVKIAEQEATISANKVNQNNKHSRKIQKIYLRQRRALERQRQFLSGLRICVRCRWQIALETEWKMIPVGAHLISTCCNHCGGDNFLSVS